jgi:hypothetical protein
VPARLILQRKPAEATARQHRRLSRKASRKGQKTDPRSVQAAGSILLLTSLPAASASAA